MGIAIYARQSVEKENSASIETQIDYCRAMLKPEEREETIREYADRGSSGKDTNRVQFQKLMHDIRQSRIQKVIVYRLDRISRSLVDFVDILQIFKEHKVKFLSAQEAFDTSSPYGELIVKILMVFAEFERESIISRIKDAYEKRSDLGLYTGGRRVYGFQLTDAVIHGYRTKKYVPVPEEAEQVQYIFQTYSRGGLSLRELRDRLLTREMHPVSGAGWTTAKLSTILKNPVYVRADVDIYEYFEARRVRIVNPVEEFDGSRAVWLYGRTTHDKALPDWSDMKVVLAGHAGLVDSRIWLKCQERLMENKQINNAMSNTSSWLSGRVVCGKCGYTMTTVRGETRRYFLCSSRYHKKTCPGTGYPVYVEEIEKIMDSCIADKLKMVKPPKQEPADQAETNILRIQQKEYEQQLALLAEKIIGGELNPQMIRACNIKAQELDSKIQDIQKRIEKIRSAPQGKVCGISLEKAWKEADFKQKRQIAGVLLQVIVLREEGEMEIIWNF